MGWLVPWRIKIEAEPLGRTHPLNRLDKGKSWLRTIQRS